MRAVCILRDLLAMALSLTAMKLDAALATCLGVEFGF